MTTQQDVLDEIERLHEFFVGWISGALPKDDALLEREMASHLDPQFAIVQPGGTLSALSELAGAIGAAHGTNPRFRIQVRNATVRWELGDVLCATYEEWQRNARASKPPDNGRVSTALFRRTPDGLTWLHVHETWLPDQVIRSATYDF